MAGMRSGSSLAFRWGRATARHPRAILLLWGLLLCVCAALYPWLRRDLGPVDFSVNGSQSIRVERILTRLLGQGAEQDVVVLRSATITAYEPAFRAAVARELTVLRHARGVEAIAGPYEANAAKRVARGRHSALITFYLRGDASQRARRADLLQAAVRRADEDVRHHPKSALDVQAWLTGSSPISDALNAVEGADIERAELLGVPLALLILLLSLRTLVAAALPLVLAGAGMLLTYGILAVLSHFIRLDITLLAIVTMVGIGIGIDYALFMVSRFIDELAAASNAECAIDDVVATVMATSGVTILCAAAVVAASLCTLALIDAALFTEMALGAASVVLGTLLAALTLLPALLALLGRRVGVGRLPPGRGTPARPPGRRGGAAPAKRRLALLARHPIPAIVLAGALLSAATLPALGLRSGVDLNLDSLVRTPAGRGAETLAESFDAGLLAPVEVVIATGSGDPLNRTEARHARLFVRALHSEHAVASLTALWEARGAVLIVTPSLPVDSLGVDALVAAMRGPLADRFQERGKPIFLVGGMTAELLDLARVVQRALPLVLGLVLGFSLLFLTLVFRSALLPVVALALNLLCTGAALGLTVFVFQDRHGEAALSFRSPGFIQAYLPLTVFALLYALSMDYEIFLVRRIREVWTQTADHELAVRRGLTHTARSISAAGGIMVAVFGSFVTADVLEVKEFGFALAVAVALDATLVRLVLLPALVSLLGAKSWWLPGGPKLHARHRQL